jgi:hypothetical protein
VIFELVFSRQIPRRANILTPALSYRRHRADLSVTLYKPIYANEGLAGFKKESSLSTGLLFIVMRGGVAL